VKQKVWLYNSWHQLKHKKMAQIFKLFGVLSISLIFGCTASTIYQPRKIDIQGDFVHKKTNTLFPINWERFKRESITIFDKDSTNIGVNYIFNNSKGKLCFY
jgi:hypothetical protein